MSKDNKSLEDIFHSNKAISDYVTVSKYARYREDLGRREVFDEIVDRTEQFHLENFPQLNKEIKDAFRLVRDKKILPSMRSLQFAGPSLAKENARGYNCCSTYIDRASVFGEIMYLLLCGCGVGYSVQACHIKKLPKVLTLTKTDVHTVEDSIEGWANAVNVLFENAFFGGAKINFDFSRIRPQGAPLKTSGGKAPGPKKLKQSLTLVGMIILEAAGRQLTSLECHDIICILSDAVLSGGIRRSALISIFDIDDETMLSAKTGDWFQKYPYRANANNSVAAIRSQVTKEQYAKLFEYVKEYGEPGVTFIEGNQIVTNPCAEIMMRPTKGENGGGFSFCNLTEINGATIESVDDFFKRVVAATLIGTLQAAYTKFNFLSKESRDIAERDALLGVSITGVLDTKLLSPNVLRAAADLAVKTNITFAKIVGINPAKRVTCIKPSGTTTLVFGISGSGVHPAHAEKYIRRITAKFFDPVFQHFFNKNPHMCFQKENGDWVIEFPMESPPNAITKDNLNAIEFLMYIKQVQENWVIPGVNHDRFEEGDPTTHNVSATCHVKEEEWEQVKEYVWDNREIFSGISFLPYLGDKVYQFSPMEAVRDAEDLRIWELLKKYYLPVDYTEMEEKTDTTTPQQERACAGGACNLD